jgi:RNA polymerase sigma factor (sigma-70 family)
MEHIPGFQKLLARARAEDRAATDELLALVRPWLEQLARGHAPDGGVSDLVQEAWLRAWQKFDQFQGADDEAQALAMFRAWMARIVTRLGLNAARDGGARQRTAPGKLLRLDGSAAAAGDSAAVPDPSAGEPSPSAHAQTAEQARLVHEALARLTDPLDRDIVRLRFFEGMSLRQVAARLGCNHETVRQRYHAVLHRLQRDLNGLA